MTIRIVLVDDQALVRTGLRMMLDAQPDMEVVGEAEDGRDAIAVVRRLHPTVVLMDIRMPDVDGVDATRALVAAGLAGRDAAQVMVLTTFGLDEIVRDALQAGASGFMLKDAEPAQLAAAVRNVAAGDAVLDPAVTRQVVELARDRPATRDPGVLDVLTDRERAVLREVAVGLSNAEIGQRLHIVEETVKTHVKHVLMKLGLDNRVQAAVLAYETGLVQLGAMSDDQAADGRNGQ